MVSQPNFLNPAENGRICGPDERSGRLYGGRYLQGWPYCVAHDDANIAYLTTVVTDASGYVIPLGSNIDAQGSTAKETYWVLERFDVEAQGRSSRSLAKLGKFSATGSAAVKLSAGFACGVSDGKDQAHCHN